MIKGVISGSGINVQGGHTSFPYVPQNSSNPIQGMLRMNGQDIQVFDGSTWMNLGSSFATVELNGETQAILQWAREQRDKQSKREALIKDNPALAKAHEAIMRAEANFDILQKFVENDAA
jgi:hypothetical protein